MAHNLTAASTFDATTSYTVPDDGDGGNVASVNGAFQSLTNRTQWLNDNKLNLSGGTMTGGLLAPSFTASGTQTSTRLQSYFGLIGIDGTNWIWGGSLSVGGIPQQKVLGAPVNLPLSNMIDGATMTGVTVRINQLSAHSGLPASMPTFTLFRVDDAAQATVASVIDSSGTVGAYNVAHNIALTGLTETALESKQYMIVFTGEAGANAIANSLQIVSVTATFTWTALKAGG